MTERQVNGLTEGGNTSTGLAGHLGEYARLYATFIKLYLQGRMLIAQNLVLSCRLQMWEVTFLCLRTRIFFTRLAHGFPLAECWPRK